MSELVETSVTPPFCEGCDEIGLAPILIVRGYDYLWRSKCKYFEHCRRAYWIGKQGAEVDHA